MPISPTESASKDRNRMVGSSESGSKDNDRMVVRFLRLHFRTIFLIPTCDSHCTFRTEEPAIHVQKLRTLHLFPVPNDFERKRLTIIAGSHCQRHGRKPINSERSIFQGKNLKKQWIWIPHSHPLSSSTNHSHLHCHYRRLLLIHSLPIILFWAHPIH